MGELIVTDPFEGTRRVPTYTCGHCSDVVVMNPARKRERRRCVKCGRTLCGRKLICVEACTPLHELAKDHYEGPGGGLVNAIMNGATSVEEGMRKGWIK